MDRNINIIVELKGEKIVLINDIRFKGKKKEGNELCWLAL